MKLDAEREARRILRDDEALAAYQTGEMDVPYPVALALDAELRRRFPDSHDADDVSFL